jgi:hypothetical protein
VALLAEIRAAQDELGERIQAARLDAVRGAFFPFCEADTFCAAGGMAR